MLSHNNYVLSLFTCNGVLLQCFICTFSSPHQDFTVAYLTLASSLRFESTPPSSLCLYSSTGACEMHCGLGFWRTAVCQNQVVHVLMQHGLARPVTSIPAQAIAQNRRSSKAIIYKRRKVTYINSDTSLSLKYPDHWADTGAYLKQCFDTRVLTDDSSPADQIRQKQKKGISWLASFCLSLCLCLTAGAVG